MSVEYIDIRLDGQDLRTIYMALDELPGKYSRALYNRIELIVRTRIEADQKPKTPLAPVDMPFVMTDDTDKEKK